MDKKNIVLVGMMGSGKTTVANLLRAKFNELELRDIDSIITELESRSINEIFETNGEDYFRDIEQNIIKAFSTSGNQIISTGGGACQNTDNICSLKENGVLFYLSAGSEELFSRIKNDGSRPLLKTDDIQATIENLLKKREPNYKLADFEIETANKTPEKIAEEIVEKYESINSINKLIVKIKPQKESEYPILIGENLLKEAYNYISEYSDAKKFLIVTNTKVDKILGDKLNIPNSERLILPDGEKYKNFESLKQIIDKAIEMKLERKDAIIAFGGGVIGDMTGFAASIYQRGVDFIQIPTTLLSQVDSAVGGKVAINHDQGKNMIGSFYQPKLVLADIITLKTLDIKQLKTGLAEVVKYAFIEKSCNSTKDYDFFNFLLQNKDQIFKLDAKVISKMIEICCSLKSSVVLQDEKEQGIRAILNFGHTFAHAVEKVTKYSVYTHGEAVAIGMKMALSLSFKKELIDKDYYDLCLKLINLYEFDLTPHNALTVENICEAMKLDKKVQSNKIRFVLPIGYKTVGMFNEIEENLIKEVVQQEL